MVTLANYQTMAPTKRVYSERRDFGETPLAHISSAALARLRRRRYKVGVTEKVGLLPLTR
jgi:hypothetical protein